ncbi:glycosyltransferase family 39 protein [Mesorhizobium sp. BR1-1-16]|uniref:glycosyltransferase family 39 protein n=1 Tax=Mesorhizobium sp. BR1-1-16 TaxID=2876653 RepID=UPI001CCF29F8|nr:glycosyltransferase family 39 protein [Mesorhizobium sp. BR1-1-16]MBZ9936679.1 glycosyltransferase family 39 protein [Mesorhizobium sp. BR1-1-16]
MTIIVDEKGVEQPDRRKMGHATGATWVERHEALALACGAFLLNLIIRLPTIGRQSFWIDEVFTAQSVARTWSGLVGERLAAGHFPTYFLLMKGLGLGGASEAMLRLPSALFESAAAALFALMAFRLGGRMAAIVTAFLFAFLPVLVYYGQEARPYAMMLFFLAIMMLGQRNLLDGVPREREAPRAGGLMASLGAIAAALTIPAAIVSIAASHIGLVMAGAIRSGADNRLRVLRHMLATWLVIGAASLVLIPSVIAEATRPHGLMKWQVNDSAANRLTSIWRELFGLAVARDANIFLPPGWERYPSLALVLLAIAGAWFGRKQPVIRYLSGMVLLTLIAFVAIGSFTATVARYLLGVVPPFLILAAYAASRPLQHRSWLRPVWAALLVVVAAMMALQTLDALHSHSRYNWNGLSEFLRASGIDDAAVLTVEPLSRELFLYYQPDAVPPAFAAVPWDKLWQSVPATGTAYVLAFDIGDGVPDGIAAGRTVCRWRIDEATFFVFTPDPASLPAPLTSCAGRLTGG